jgi:streptogramin lyase/uncharacterized protein YegL
MAPPSPAADIWTAWRRAMTVPGDPSREVRQPAVARVTADRFARTSSAAVPVAPDAPAAPNPRTYTLDADFDEGAMVGVNHDPPGNDQLQLNRVPSTFPFIWIALSGRDTVVKIDTRSGEILGEYFTRPEGRPGNPSRTTVDLDGNVWVGNRNEAGGSPTRDGGVTGSGSIVRVSLLESGGCVDRNANGRIDTSKGLRDVRPWPNTGDADTAGGVSTAEDECITSYLRVPPGGVRTIAVDDMNNLWVGGISDRVHAYIDTHTGQVLRSTPAACGGYGGLIDADGVLWSASGGPNTLYLDTRADPLVPRCLDTRTLTSYGLGVNNDGYVFNSTFGSDSVIRFSPSGLWLGEFPTHGASGDRGVAVTPIDNNVWVANSAGSNVTRLDEDGSVRDVIDVGSSPTGVAVDAAGKVWSANMGSNSASRIDPARGRQDLEVNLGAGASPYNYSDMTGMVSRGFTTRRGTWLVIHDSGEAGTPWGIVRWTSLEPPGTAVTVRVRSGDAVPDLGAQAWQTVASGVPVPPMTGRYLQVEAVLTTDINLVTPILYDLTVVPAGVVPPTVTPTVPPTPTPTRTPTPTVTRTHTATPTPTSRPKPLYLPLLVREACPDVVLHANIALVLDASTSMLDATATGQSKLDAARAAVRTFLDTVNLPDDRATLVAFNETATVVEPLTGVRAALRAALGRITVETHTRTDLALQVARAELTRGAASHPDHRAVIVLLTDGLPNPVSPDEVRRVADGVKGDGIVVYTIGLGTDVNAPLLREVATTPDAYYASPDGDDLEALYRRIAVRLRCPGAQFWPAR